MDSRGLHRAGSAHRLDGLERIEGLASPSVEWQRLRVDPDGHPPAAAPNGKTCRTSIAMAQTV